MSFLSETKLQDVIAMYPSRLDRDELRLTKTGLLTTALQMTNSPDAIVSGDVKEKALNSEGIDLKIPVLKNGDITISNTRSCTIAGENSESALVTAVWKTVSIDVFMVPSQYKTNYISYQADLAKKIRKAVNKFMVEMETDIESTLDTVKTQVYNSGYVGAGNKYPLVANAIQVATAQEQLFFNDVDSINFSDDFDNDTVKVVGSPELLGIVNFYSNQGDGNNTNYKFQYPGKEFGATNRITNAAGVKATGYFMPDGSIGVLTRNAWDSRLRHEAGDGSAWFEMRLPDMPFDVGVQFKSKCSDQSALNGTGYEHLKASLVENWQFSFDYAILTPYNRDPATVAGAIRKFEITTA